MKTMPSRSIFELKQAAQQQLRPMENLFHAVNTALFMVWWSTFTVIFILGWWLPWLGLWWVRLIVLAVTLFKTYLYFPHVVDYVRNVRTLRSLADEARLQFVQDGELPSRLSWDDIIGETGGVEPTPAHIARRPGLKWGWTHVDLFNAYLVQLAREFDQHRRLLRAERRALRRSLGQHVESQPATSPSANISPAPASSPKRDKVVRPVTPKARRERRSPPQPLTPPQPVTRQVTIDELIADLSLRSVLPWSIDVDHAQTILIWGLIKPGRRNGAFIGSHSLSIDFLQKSVSSKLQPDYDAYKFQAALDWLVRQGVVTSTPKQGHRAYSLNTSSARLTPAGQRVVELVNRFMHQAKAAI